MKELSKDEINQVFKELQLETEKSRNEKLFKFDKKTDSEKNVYTVSESATSDIESENADLG